MSFTYAELRQAIQDYVENAEQTFVNNIPLFIRLAEERILKSVRLDLFQRNQAAVLTAGNQFLAKPPDFLAPLSMLIEVGGGRQFLELKDLSFVQEFNVDPTATGVPRFFGVFDAGVSLPSPTVPVGNFILGPTPDQSYPVELQYFYRPASLTVGGDSDKTWLSDNAPLALLYGALFEAYTFLKGEPDLMQLYAARFQESIARLKDLGEAKEPTTDYRYGRLAIPRT
jgi:hypothetical protein